MWRAFWKTFYFSLCSTLFVSQQIFLTFGLVKGKFCENHLSLWCIFSWYSLQIYIFSKCMVQRILFEIPTNTIFWLFCVQESSGGTIFHIQIDLTSLLLFVLFVRINQHSFKRVQFLTILNIKYFLGSGRFAKSDPDPDKKVPDP